MELLVPVLTGEVVSPFAARTPITPPEGVVVAASSAPKISGVPSPKTFPEIILPLSPTVFVSAEETGVSSTMFTVTV